MALIEPFNCAIPQDALDDLHRRLDHVRWPEPATEEGWGQGVPLDAMRQLVDHWRWRHDWRACEGLLNRLGQFRTELDGLSVHFLHVRSRHDGAFPLLLTHGWPGSVLEFQKVIGPLTDPTAHGGDRADAFHVIVPSLPGYGFSGKPTAAGWGVERIARAWGLLMTRLGYARYGAQGGDWGSAITINMGVQRPAGLAGIHLNMLSIAPPEALAAGRSPDAEEQRALDAARAFAEKGSGYAKLQATRPQTIGYALADSPVGQAAWIYEKLRYWSDCDGDPLTIFTPDEILDDISLYWLTNCGASSGRLYWESMGSFRPTNVTLPVGFSAFPKEIIKPSRKWAERLFPEIIHWNEVDRGGHFAALEQPALFVEEVRACFRHLR